MSEILTVGHSNHEEAAFVELLRGAGVELIADVRRHPGSRRQPHFERTALAGVLLEAGIEYRWLGESLGGRRKPAPDSPNGAWENQQFRGYADHMASAEFEEGLAAEVMALVDRLGSVPEIAGYHLVHSVRGDLLGKLGRHAEAADEFTTAAALAGKKPAHGLEQQMRGALKRLLDPKNILPGGA